MRSPSCFALLCLLACLLAPPARGATTELWEEAGVLVDRWTTDDGLPLNHTIDVAVSPAGFVWISTLDGLVRFDGVEFRVYRRSDYPELPTNRLLNVVMGEGEVPWAITESGALLRFNGDGFDVWTTEGEGFGGIVQLAGRVWIRGGAAPVWRVGPDGPQPVPGLTREQSVRTLAEVGDEVWLGTRDGGVWRVSGDGPAELVAGTEGLLAVNGVAPDGDGGVWLGAQDGLWRLGPAGLERVESGRAALPIRAMVGTDRLWVWDSEGWWTWDGARREDLDLPGAWSGPPEALSGAPWRDTVDGVTPGRGPTWVMETYPRGIARGPDGSVWVGSNGEGLFRFRAPSVHAVGAEYGDFIAVLAAPDGSIWARTWGAPPRRFAPDGAALPVPDFAAPNEYGAPGLGVGPGGEVWLASPEGTCAVRGERCVPVEPAPGGGGRRSLVTTLSASDGSLWLQSTDGLYRGEEGADGWRWEERTPEGGSRASPTSLSEAPDGALWLATRRNGVFAIRPEGATRYGRAEGLSSDIVRSIYAAPDGGVWAGTEDAGLCHITPATGAARCLGVREGLSDDVVHSLAVDDHGRLWMSGNRGISWVLLSQLEAWRAGEQDFVLSLQLDERDGMVKLEGNGGFGPAVARSQDGRLWFPTLAGLAVVEPARVPIPEGPKVHLEPLRVGDVRREADASGWIALSADERAIEARWTVPETVWPDQVRYRYRLRGLEDDWHGPVEARYARWTNLPPGALHVEVQAALGGDWGPTASLALRRQPAFVETRAFQALLALGGLGFGVVMLVGQGLRSRRRRVELEALVAARTRDLAGKNAELTLTSARLAEADAMRTRLIADLSHELRTPLTLVSGPLEDLAESGEVPEGAARARLEVVRQNAQRLEELVDQLLDLTRLESGKLLLRVRRLDLAAFSRRLAGRFEPQCARKGLRLHVETPEGDTTLFFDPDLLDKIVSNLLSNALKFTPEGGQITLSVALPEDEERPACVVVRDTGPGIPEAQQGRLFDRFVQGDSGDARRFEGVGIGLALARDLVTLHGGDIGVDSAPGEGSAFWFTLPRGVDHLGPEDVSLNGALRVDPSPAPVASLPAEQAEGGALPELLVVEDHPDMRDFLVSHLQRAFRVRAAEGGARALALARALRPAVIVSDVMMPEMDGLELCRRLRADPELADVPVLLASAKASEADRVAGLEVADDYMSKPLRMRELLARAQKLANRGRLEGEACAEPAPGPTLGVADLALRDRVEAVIQARMGEADFGVAEMAKALAYSRRQLLREVQRVCGESPSDLLRARRMEAGRALLDTGAVSTVAEAALRVGLSPAYFSRTFTAWYGRAPSDVLLRGRA